MRFAFHRSVLVSRFDVSRMYEKPLPPLEKKLNSLGPPGFTPGICVTNWPSGPKIAGSPFASVGPTGAGIAELLELKRGQAEDVEYERYAAGRRRVDAGPSG